MRILVTGAEGFVGRVLSKRFTELGADLLGTSRDGSVGVALDLVEEPARVVEVFAEFRPEVVLHLAAISAVGAAEQNPQSAHAVNVAGTRVLIGAALSLATPPHFIHISSCAVYGNVAPAGQPMREDLAARPLNVYAVTKLVSESLFTAETALPWTILRPFNHTGPGQSPEFSLSGFARQIALIERGSEAPRIAVGNLDVARDFLDVRDVADAYWRVAGLAGHARTYNVCSGVARPLRELLHLLSGMARVQIETVVDPQRLRSVDQLQLAGDPRAFHEATGWTPRIPIEQTLADLLDYWRLEVANTGRGR